MEGMGKCDGRTKLETMIATFRTDVDMPVNICFAALRLRAKLAQTRVTHVPRMQTGGTPIPTLLAEQG